MSTWTDAFNGPVTVPCISIWFRTNLSLIPAGVFTAILDGSSTSGALWGCKELVQRAVAVRDDELGPSLRVVDVVAHAGRAEVWSVVVLCSCELPKSEAGKMTVVNWNLGLWIR